MVHYFYSVWFGEVKERNPPPPPPEVLMTIRTSLFLLSGTTCSQTLFLPRCIYDRYMTPVHLFVFWADTSSPPLLKTLSPPFPLALLLLPITSTPSPTQQPLLTSDDCSTPQSSNTPFPHFGTFMNPSRETPGRFQEAVASSTRSCQSSNIYQEKRKLKHQQGSLSTKGV